MHPGSSLVPVAEGCGFGAAKQAEMSVSGGPLSLTDHYPESVDTPSTPPYLYML